MHRMVFTTHCAAYHTNILRYQSSTITYTIYIDYILMFLIKTTITCHPKCISYQPTKCMQRQNTSKDEITYCYCVSKSNWHLHVDAWFHYRLLPCWSTIGSLAATAIYYNPVIPRQHEMMQSPACCYNKMIIDAKSTS